MPLLHTPLLRAPYLFGLRLWAGYGWSGLRAPKRRRVFSPSQVRYFLAFARGLPPTGNFEEWRFRGKSFRCALNGGEFIPWLSIVAHDDGVFSRTALLHIKSRDLGRTAFHTLFIGSHEELCNLNVKEITREIEVARKELLHSLSLFT